MHQLIHSTAHAHLLALAHYVLWLDGCRSWCAQLYINTHAHLWASALLCFSPTVNGTDRIHGYHGNPWFFRCHTRKGMLSAAFSPDSRLLLLFHRFYCIFYVIQHGFILLPLYGIWCILFDACLLKINLPPIAMPYLHSFKN